MNKLTYAYAEKEEAAPELNYHFFGKHIPRQIYLTFDTFILYL